MIQPEDILRKTSSIYREYLRAWLAGASDFFPRLVPADRDPGTDVVAAVEGVRRLREGSKEVLGYGYTIEWREVRSRTHGRNPFPQRIVFATEKDLLSLCRKEAEFRRFTTAVTRLRQDFPELDAWIRSNIRLLSDAEAEIEGLLEVIRHFREYPRPGCFARELPLSVDTKFVQRHRRILREWLDLVLPSHTIRADEEHFERRFGLRYVEPDLFLRFLDDGLRDELGFPCSVLSLPLHTAEAMRPPSDVRVFVVENRVNLLTLPCLPRMLAFGGLGNAASLLQYVRWLNGVPLTYWGDVDTEGLEILSRVRSLFPQTKSLFMDGATCERFRGLMIAGTGRRVSCDELPGLTEGERQAFAMCQSENLRLEQERLPQGEVERVVLGSFVLSTSKGEAVDAERESGCGPGRLPGGLRGSLALQPRV